MGESAMVDLIFVFLTPWGRKVKFKEKPFYNRGKASG
jgi:hypothetical protein